METIQIDEAMAARIFCDCRKMIETAVRAEIKNGLSVHVILPLRRDLEDAVVQVLFPAI